LKVGLTVDAAGNPDEFKTLLNILNEYKIKSTFFVGVNIKPDLIKTIHKNGHEIGNHTYSHPNSLLNLDFEKKELEIKSAHSYLLSVLNEEFIDAKINGFRAPYYNFDPDIPKIIEKMKYIWDSTKAYFPLLGSNFKLQKYGEIIELPSLFPDDSTMTDRLGLTEEQILKIWKKSFESSTDIFVLGIHPYISVKNLERINMLKKFIEYALGKKSEFMTLSEIVGTL
jgi:peptidoglycan/xylan/chitin deacetylase (PgdA/CDA1 family)